MMITSQRNSGELSTQSGVTLVELMTVVVIVSILTVIAYPSYRDFVQRSYRTEAKEALMHLAANQEKFYLQNHTYSTDLAALGFGSSATENGRYVLEVVAADQQGYTLLATADGGMSDDSDCLEFGLNEAGSRTASPDPRGQCW